MKIIEQLSDMIEEELNDAEKYARCAMNWKWDRPALSVAFLKLSNEEMGHVNILHEQVNAIIMEYRKEHGDPPERMMAVYEYLHKRQIEKANDIRIMQSHAK